LKLRPLIICAGLSILAHLGLLAVELHPPQPLRLVPRRIEIGLVARTWRPEFSHARSPAAARVAVPSRPSPVQRPAPITVPGPQRLPRPAIVAAKAANYAPESPPQAPQPSQPPPTVLPDPAGELAATARSQASSAASQPVLAAAPLYADNPPPAYPERARRNDWSGEVLVKVAVAASGAVTATDLANSSGHPILDEAAMAAVRNWHFVPARQGSRTLPGVVLVPIRFRLTGPGH
jgi:periplasmic protein TonB